MNAKLCKRLRREAYDATIGQPLRALTHGRGSLALSTVNAPHTTRGVYRNLKRAQRARR